MGMVATNLADITTQIHSWVISAKLGISKKLLAISAKWDTTCDSTSLKMCFCDFCEMGYHLRHRIHPGAKLKGST